MLNYLQIDGTVGRVGQPENVAAFQQPEAMITHILAAADQMSHVWDNHLFFDHNHTIFRIGLTKQTFMYLLTGALTLLFLWI